ncbi:MAG: sigma-70 family RNA polymerase sigma factor [Brumimicrobium sp.]
MENSRQEHTELIQAILAGDKKRFAEIVDLHKNLVYSILLRMTDDHDEANDLAQEVFIKVFRQLKQFKGKSKLSTWIYKIAYFHGLSYLRKRKRWFIDVNKIDVQVADNVDEEIELSELKGHVSECIRSLKPLERAAITLFYLEEMNMKEVAEIMNITESYVKVTVHRAKKSLKEMIKKEYYEGVRR